MPNFTLIIDYTWHPIYPQKADKQLKQTCEPYTSPPVPLKQALVPDRTSVSDKVSDRMGVIDKVPDRTGVINKVPDSTGVINKVPDNTGVINKVPDSTGVINKVPENSC